MKRAKADIRVGTSGWHYEHWRERFYPAEVSKSDWLGYYAQHFDTVEINNTFYHQPKDATVEKWQQQAPKGFLYAVKASRFITHIKRLKDASESLERFLKSSALLREKLGPILYQLPPSFHKNLDVLETFLNLLPKSPRAVFEFRHKTWFTDDTFELLKKYNAAFCIHDMQSLETPRVVTADFIYIRFHGPSGRYSGNYTKPLLKDWAQWIKEDSKKARSIFVYFNNDINAYAVYNAKTLKEQF